jgi:hypothetical protein
LGCYPSGGVRASIEVVLAIRIGPLLADALLLLFLVEVGRQHAPALELAHKGRRTDHVIEHGGSMGGAWGEQARDRALRLL